MLGERGDVKKDSKLMNSTIIVRDRDEDATVEEFKKGLMDTETINKEGVHKIEVKPPKASADPQKKEKDIQPVLWYRCLLR